MSYKIGIIGMGNMGGAIAKSIAQGATEGSFVISGYDVNDKVWEGFKGLGIIPKASVEGLVKDSDIVILAVKPQYAMDVLSRIKEVLTPEKILLSIIVGLPISYYKNILGSGARIIRTMPNTPVLVGAGMTLVCFDEYIKESEKDTVMKLLGFTGMVEEMEEKLMNEVTALTGSSPAYVFILIEAMADAAVQSGIPRKRAYQLASQAVMGSAKMVLETGMHPGELKDMVCSPAGTTIEAVTVLEREGFRNAIIAAMGECTKKAKEIGKG